MTFTDRLCRVAVLAFALALSPSALGAGTANLQTLDVTANPAILMTAAAAGAIGVRATPNTGWHGVEPVLGGGYRFAVTDAAQLAVQAAGLDYFRILQSSRPEYNPSPAQYADRGYLLPHFAPGTGLDLWSAYKNFVRAVVRRYYRTAAEGNPDAMPGLTRGVRYWSYTPEIGTFWVPITDPVRGATDYATMFALTASAVHEVDPTATVFLPFNGSPYLAAFVDGFLPRTTIDYKGQRGLTKEQVLAAYGGVVTFVRSILQGVDPDAYDLHLYGDAESIPGQEAWLLASLASIGKPRKPVWSMEGGEPYGGLGESFRAGPSTCSGGSVAEDASRLAFQSAAMVKHFSLAFANGYESVTFNLSPEYADSGTWFGDLDLLDACSKARPAFFTYRLCRDELVPYATAAEIAGVPASVRLVRFTFAPPKGDVYVAWNPALGVTSTAPHDLSGLLGIVDAKVTHPVTIAGKTSPEVTTEPTTALVFGGTPVFLEAASAPTASSRIVVPIVLDVDTGAAHYTTELILTNAGPNAQNVSLIYTPSLGTKQGGGAVTVALSAGQQATYSNAIATLRSLGLPIPPSSPTSPQGGTLAASWEPRAGAVHATARTTTPTLAPQPAGNAGLAYGARAPSEAITSRATIYGLRSTAADRSNLALYNAGVDPVTVKVTAFSGSGDGRSAVIAAAETLPPYGWKQYSGFLDGTGITNAWVVVERLSSTGRYAAYGVVNDNATNDGSFIEPVPEVVSGASLTLPVLVETERYRSELVLANKGTTTVTFALAYAESLSPALGPGGTVNVTLPPGTQRILPEAIDFLRSAGGVIGPKGAASYAGAVRITISGAPLADVYAGARTASPSPVGGQFGLFASAVPAGSEATDRAALYGLSADAFVRTNVVVVNAGSVGAGPVALKLDVLDGSAGGALKSSLSVTLDPGQWVQPAGLFAGSGVANGYVNITRTAGTAPWLAYGVVNDGGQPGQRTGDGAYVTMSLPE